MSNKGKPTGPHTGKNINPTVLKLRGQVSELLKSTEALRERNSNQREAINTLNADLSLYEQTVKDYSKIINESSGKIIVLERDIRDEKRLVRTLESSVKDRRAASRKWCLFSVAMMVVCVLLIIFK